MCARGAVDIADADKCGILIRTFAPFVRDCCVIDVLLLSLRQWWWWFFVCGW